MFLLWSEPMPHLSVPHFRVSSPISSRPAPGPVQVQYVLPLGERVLCASKSLRGSVRCWRRRCQVVSRQRMGWAPPGLDTEPTRTSSWALFPSRGKQIGALINCSILLNQCKVKWKIYFVATSVWSKPYWVLYIWLPETVWVQSVISDVRIEQISSEEQ